MEKIIRDHINADMKANHFLSNKQYRFISRRSTTLQLLYIIDTWTEAIDQKIAVVCIYLDFMKAFDTVPHRILVEKVNHTAFNQVLTTGYKTLVVCAIYQRPTR